MKRVQLVIGGHPVTVAFDADSIHVFNAFPVKDQLKLRGYRWNSLQKSWDFHGDDVKTEMAHLQGNGAPAPTQKVPETMPEGLPESVTVSELRERIDALLRSALPSTLWIRGVVASEPKAYRWATYFDLRDEDDSLDMVFSCEMRQGERERIEQRLSATGVAAGLEKELPVFLEVEVGLSRKYTLNLRLRALDILPEFTRERLRSQRDITVERLRREGLLDLQKALHLPMLLHRVGLVTSALGTSVRDIMAGLTPVTNRYHIGFLDTRMEGGGAVEGLISALDFLESRSSWTPDAVVIARGGGSEQSLGVFNDYRLCARICRCRIPVLTAIGHEKDVSAAEICSHFTPKPSTPSGMGRFLRERFMDLQTRLGESVARLVERFTAVHRLEGERVRSNARQLPRQLHHRLQWVGSALRGCMGDFLRLGLRLTREQGGRVKEMQRSLRMRSSTTLSKEWKQLGAASARMDFFRRRRLQDAAAMEVLQLLREGKAAAQRNLAGAGQDVEARENLARASHPDRILERGFTLTLGPDGKVVPTAQAFRGLSWARLRFSDGTERIERKEE